MKKTAIVLVALFGFTAAFAQLSTRESDPINLKFGTRPQAGNMSVYFGIGSQELDEIQSKNKDVTGLPLISLRYYLSDQTVGRIVLKSFSSKEIMKGTLSANQTGVSTDKTINSEYMLVPGLERHFSTNNIFDVYLAGGLPLGIQRNVGAQNLVFNAAGDYSEVTVSKFSFIYGVEALLGIQAYISFLPVSIGIEAGTRGIGYARQQYKNEQTTVLGGVKTSQTFYTTGNDPAVVYTQFKDLKYRKYNMDNEFRVIISYYFRR